MLWLRLVDRSDTVTNRGRGAMLVLERVQPGTTTPLPIRTSATVTYLSDKLCALYAGSANSFAFQVSEGPRPKFAQPLASTDSR